MIIEKELLARSIYLKITPFEFKHLQYCRKNVQKTDTQMATTYFNGIQFLHFQMEINRNGAAASMP
ncbi:hypothetical protein [Pedobacter sp. AJM]|uniref:hypothetical protein n=1 Tax=Pedobacter sp. AJM TaxID=2003629 RepID=UPI000B4BE7B2|nr:hypothetical protein [Pedobacter sp. AJM]OWK68755.1 hypothetical protein CBW18_20465 [Pedobacter sp. AJM]